MRALNIKGLLRSCERGAELIELSIALPICLALILFAFDLGRASLAYSAVRTAVMDATDRARATHRGNWPAINNVYSSIGLLPTDPLPVSVTPTAFNIRPLFESGAPNFGYANRNWYACQSGEPSANPALCPSREGNAPVVTELYPAEVRAIAYANVLLGRSMGLAGYPGEGPGYGRCMTDRVHSDYMQRYALTGATWLRSNVLSLYCEVDLQMFSSSLTFGGIPPVVTISARREVPIGPSGYFIGSY